MQFETGIWRASAQNFWVNKFVALICISLLAWPTILGFGLATNYATSFLGLAWLPLAINAHAIILNRRGGYTCYMAGNPKSFAVPFIFTSVNLTLIALISALGLIIFLGPEGKQSFRIEFYLTFWIIQAVVFAYWVTMLAACVAGGDLSSEAAGRRGSKTFSYSLVRVFICNGLLILLVFWLEIMSPELAMQVAINTQSELAFTIAHWTLTVINLSLYAFSIVMLATILSRAYIIAEDAMNKAPAAASAS